MDVPMFLEERDELHRLLCDTFGRDAVTVRIASEVDYVNFNASTGAFKSGERLLLTISCDSLSRYGRLSTSTEAFLLSEHCVTSIHGSSISSANTACQLTPLVEPSFMYSPIPSIKSQKSTPNSVVLAATPPISSSSFLAPLLTVLQ